MFLELQGFDSADKWKPVSTREERKLSLATS